ncbi:putative enoyl-coA hydratase [Actinacidiphila reveromycinica]|uniref:enoyl-CoA hydratase n=1 Tax=Actinacidiphila reveromycinica TaxID=659352 RepID=A0A7U3UZX7_9ACTN|nr:enoyl-CoA hydratase/isomerase family protein [Streptomyces sp. SN-593]BBB01922.1 putative enoyl-coA hydratase [Streptomyces sp. SN-593]
MPDELRPPTAGDDTVLYAQDGRVAVLTLNRPHRANAFDAALRRRLRELTDRVAGDETVGAVVLTGAGRHFSGGADLRETPEQRAAERGRPIGLDQLPKPVIAAINGAALGGGCEIALTCDFRFVAEGATLGLPEIRFGALPQGGGTARLPRLVGPGPARRMIMTGDPVSADEALRIGLADQVLPPGELLPAAVAFAAHLAERPGYALGTAKALLNASLETDLRTALAAERRLAAEMAGPREHAAARARAARTADVYARAFRTGAPSPED